MDGIVDETSGAAFNGRIQLENHVPISLNAKALLDSKVSVQYGAGMKSVQKL